jgi:hypothetical protein
LRFYCLKCTNPLTESVVRFVTFLLSTYEIWKVLVSLAKKKNFFFANFHVLGLLYLKNEFRAIFFPSVTLPCRGFLDEIWGIEALRQFWQPASFEPIWCTTAAAAARDRRKFFYCFFHVLWLFIGKKHDLSKKKFFKIFGMKPILSLIYFIYAESENQAYHGIGFRKYFWEIFENRVFWAFFRTLMIFYGLLEFFIKIRTANSFKNTTSNDLKSNNKPSWSKLRSLYRLRPFQRAQICEDWSLGTGDIWCRFRKAGTVINFWVFNFAQKNIYHTLDYV